jgi:hypothetical protein
MAFAKRLIVALVCLAVFEFIPVISTSAQCTSSQDAAVDCFVNNAVKTGLTSPRYGMNLSQFRAYGVSVSKILETQDTYLVLVGTASAIADAMPPTNTDGSANAAAQQSAVSSIVGAMLSSDLATLPQETTPTDLQYFSMDLVNAMNTSGGYLQLLTPGISLRVIDSYVVTGTTNGAVNWASVDASLSTAINNLITSGLIKLPSGVSLVQVNSFVDSVAQAIWNYKQATGRAHL